MTTTGTPFLEKKLLSGQNKSANTQMDLLVKKRKILTKINHYTRCITRRSAQRVAGLISAA